MKDVTLVSGGQTFKYPTRNKIFGSRNKFFKCRLLVHHGLVSDESIASYAKLKVIKLNRHWKKSLTIRFLMRNFVYDLSLNFL